MFRRFSFDKMFEGNKLVLICILITIHVVISTIVHALAGSYFTLSLSGLFWVIIYSTAPILPIAICQHLMKLNKISEKRYEFLTSIPPHFIFSCGLLVFYVFLMGLWQSTLFPVSVYLITITNYVVGYILVISGAAMIDAIQTAAVNRDLKKIRESQAHKKDN
ncbi:MAG: hypothetical protein FWE05_07695 [Defluviitaleaceae bacterium]|nr:hypothetical protein [Defluviitaleaceae bacterium]